MYPEAITFYEKGIAIGGAVALQKAFLGHVYGSAGDHDKARHLLEELQEMSHHAYVPSLNMAIIYDGLGEKDLAIESLERAYDNRDALLVAIKVWPHFDNLRGESRFHDIERRLGLLR